MVITEEGDKLLALLKGIDTKSKSHNLHLFLHLLCQEKMLIRVFHLLQYFNVQSVMNGSIPVASL